MGNKEIANTIWSQMKAIDTNLCMCMGVKNLCAVESGLEFKVSGLSFKGIIQIKLNGKDLYDVSFIKPVRKQNKVAKDLGVKMFDTSFETVKSFNDVYVDDLMPLLEENVESRG